MVKTNRSAVDASSKRPVRAQRYAFFERVVSNGNEVVLRRWAKVDVRLEVRTGCSACQELLTVVQALPCIGKVQRREIQPHEECHRHVVLLAPRAAGGHSRGDMVGSLTMPSTTQAAVFHRELVSDLRVRKPFKPLPQQAAYADQFSAERWPTLPPGILLGFALGSGKTHATLHLAESRGATLLSVVCAVSLIGQWQESIETHAPSSSDAPVVEYRIYGYDRFAALVHTNPRLVAGSMVAVDESHTLKNMTDTMLPSIEALQLSSCCQFLTGTPIRNDVRDFDLVLRLLGLGDAIPNVVDGEAGYGDRTWAVSRGPNAIPPDPYEPRPLRRYLLERLKGRVALYNPRYCEPRVQFMQHYPQTVESVTYHELTWEQVLELFLYGDGVSIKINGDRRVNIGAAGGFLRRLSILNAVGVEPYIFSSKADALINGIEKVARFPQVVYSRFKANLLKPLSDRISKHFGVTTRILTGDTPAKERQPLLDAYNRGEISVLLICSVGSEGLDLTAPTTAMHLLEPQHNIPEEQQIFGRVVRFSTQVRDWEHDIPIAIIRYVCRFPREEPRSKKTLAYLAEVVNDHPAVVQGFTGARPGRDQDARAVKPREIITFLKRRIREENNRTEEEIMYESSRLKYGRTRPLEVLLWMASTTAPTPNLFRNEWADLMGEAHPPALPEPELAGLKAKRLKEESKIARAADREIRHRAALAKKEALIARIDMRLKLRAERDMLKKDRRMAREKAMELREAAGGTPRKRRKSDTIKRTRTINLKTSSRANSNK